MKEVLYFVSNGRIETILHILFGKKKLNENVFLAYKQKYLSKENKCTNVTGLL